MMTRWRDMYRSSSGDKAVDYAQHAMSQLLAFEAKSIGRSAGDARCMDKAARAAPRAAIITKRLAGVNTIAPDWARLLH